MSYEDLSLTGRTAIALCCVARLCQRTGFQHEELSRFLAYMWEFPLAYSFPDGFEAWESARPPLVEVGLGDSLPPDVETTAASAGLPAPFFAELLMNAVEITWGSFYGMADDKGSLAHLQEVIKACRQYGVNAPPPSEFAVSLFADQHGWGAPVTAATRDAWRRLERDDHDG